MAQKMLWISGGVMACLLIIGAGYAVGQPSGLEGEAAFPQWLEASLMGVGALTAAAALNQPRGINNE